MAFADRARETTTTTGPGDVTLLGAFDASYQTLNAAIGINKFFNYAIRHQTPGEWETGRGYLSNSTTLVRVRVWESSNSDALVSFSAGTKDVWIDIPAMQVMDKGNALGLAMRLAMN